MNINTHNWCMPRRTFLKGLGVSLALPWLEVMSANAKDITTAGSMAEHEIPRRALFTFWGLGRGTDWLHAAGHRQELTRLPRRLRLSRRSRTTAR